MAEPDLSPEECRKRAAACRNMARTEKDAATRKRIEDIATAWEHLCEELSELERRKK